MSKDTSNSSLLTSDSSRLKLKTLRVPQRENYGTTTTPHTNSTRKPYSRQQQQHPISSYGSRSEPRIMTRSRSSRGTKEVEVVPATPPFMFQHSIAQPSSSSIIRPNSTSKGLLEKVKEIISPWRWFVSDQKPMVMMEEEAMVRDDFPESESRVIGDEGNDNEGDDDHHRKTSMKRSIAISTSDEEGEHPPPLQKTRRISQEPLSLPKLDGFKLNTKTRDTTLGESTRASRHPVPTKVANDPNVTVLPNGFHRGAPSPTTRRYELLVHSVLQKGDQPLTREEFENFARLLKENTEENFSTDETVSPRRDQTHHLTTPSRPLFGRAESVTKTASSSFTSPFQFAPRSAARQPTPSTPSYYGVGYNVRSTPFKVFPVQSANKREIAESQSRTGTRERSNVTPGAAAAGLGRGDKPSLSTGESAVSVGKSPFASATAKKILETLETMTSPINMAEKRASSSTTTATPRSIVKRRQFYAKEEKPIRILEDAPPSRPLTLPAEIAPSLPTTRAQRQPSSMQFVAASLPQSLPPGIPESPPMSRDNQIKQASQIGGEFAPTLPKGKEKENAKKPLPSEHIERSLSTLPVEPSLSRKLSTKFESPKPSFTARHIEDYESPPEDNNGYPGKTTLLSIPKDLPVFSFGKAIDTIGGGEEVKLTEKIIAEQTLPAFQFPPAEKPVQPSLFGSMAPISNIGITSTPTWISSTTNTPVLPGSDVSSNARPDTIVPAFSKETSKTLSSRLDVWKCSVCSSENQKEQTKCKGCGGLNPLLPHAGPSGETKVSESVKSLSGATPSDGWRCPVCMIMNNKMAKTCAACDNVNPDQVASTKMETKPISEFSSTSKFPSTTSTGFKFPTSFPLTEIPKASTNEKEIGKDIQVPTVLSTSKVQEPSSQALNVNTTKQPLFGFNTFKPVESSKVGKIPSEPTTIQAEDVSSTTLISNKPSETKGFGFGKTSTADVSFPSKSDKSLPSSKPSDTSSEALAIDRSVQPSIALSAPSSGAENNLSKKVSQGIPENPALSFASISSSKLTESVPAKPNSTTSTTMTTGPNLATTQTETTTKPTAAFTFGAPPPSSSNAPLPLAFTFSSTPTPFGEMKTSLPPFMSTSVSTSTPPLFTFGGGTGMSESRPVTVPLPKDTTSSVPMTTTNTTGFKLPFSSNPSATAPTITTTAPPTPFTFGGGTQPPFGQDSKIKNETNQPTMSNNGSTSIFNMSMPSNSGSSNAFTPPKLADSSTTSGFSFGEKESISMSTTPMSLDTRSPGDTSMSTSVAPGSSTTGFGMFRAPTTLPPPVFSFGQNLGSSSTMGLGATNDKGNMAFSSSMPPVGMMSSAMPPSTFSFGAPQIPPPSPSVMPSSFTFGQSAAPGTAGPSSFGTGATTTTTFPFDTNQQSSATSLSLNPPGPMTESFQFNVGASDPPGSRKIAKARSRLPRR